MRSLPKLNNPWTLLGVVTVYVVLLNTVLNTYNRSGGASGPESSKHSNVIVKRISANDIEKEQATEHDKNRQLGETSRGKFTPGVTSINDVSPDVTSRDKITPVLIVAYQRSGSTFIGNVLSHDPDNFYWFEPLDAVYQSLYGFPHGWTVPSDLTTNADGSVRFIPDRESSAVINTLYNIFTCSLEKLPTELLSNPFLATFAAEQPSLAGYLKCLGKKLIKDILTFNKHLKNKCPNRPSPWRTMHERCYNELGQDSMKDSDGFYKLNSSDNGFNVYKNCFNSARKQALACLPELKQACQKSIVRSVKAIRITMEDAGRLQEKLPELKIIHNVRHPLGIAKSRKRFGPVAPAYMSYFSRTNPDTEARILCRKIYRDLQNFTQLHNKTPSGSKVVTYEKLSAAPAEHVREIYKFIGRNHPPKEVEDWMRTATKNSENISLSWQRGISLLDYVRFKNSCKDMFSEYSDVFQTVL